MARESKFKYAMLELAHHLPYSIFGVTVGLLAMGVLTFFAILMRAEGLLAHASEEVFHVFHPAHILISAVVTTAMFWKHEKRLLKAVMVGFFGSVPICVASDIFFPYIGGVLMGSPMQMHVCILEEPGVVYPFAIVGILAGLVVPDSFEHSTQYTHAAHVFISSAASILYLIGYGLVDWIHSVGAVFVISTDQHPRYNERNNDTHGQYDEDIFLNAFVSQRF